MSSIYHKIQAVRDALAEAQLEKTGHNTAGDFMYYEEADFMPQAVAEFKKQNLFNHVSFDKDLATLTFIDLDNVADRITFTAPMSTAADKKLHPVQNQGWAQTYLKRRLYINALGLTEQDPLDGRVGEPAQRRLTVDEKLAEAGVMAEKEGGSDGKD